MQTICLFNDCSENGRTLDKKWSLNLRTPPKYAALRLAWEAYYIVFDVLTIKTRIHHQYLLSGRGTTGTAFRNKDTHLVLIR